MNNRTKIDYPVIGIRPCIDAREGALGVRQSLEEQTMNMAKAVAFCYNRDYVIPDDICYIFNDVVKHRLVLSGQARLRAINKKMIIDDILRRTKMPRVVVS